jgi:hypothetical protein
MQEVRQNQVGIKSYLMRQLRKERAFWSFDKASCRDLSDRNLIKYVLIHLDLKDTDRLFDLYPQRLIKRVWRDELVPQGDYLLSMNLCYALLYFDAKRPLQYVKSLITRHINQWKKR